MKAYPSYKDSGVPWLELVPEHWEIRRTKYILKETDRRSNDGAEQLLSVSQYTGVTPRKTKDDSDIVDSRARTLVGYKIVQGDDLVVNIMLAWNGSLGVSPYSGIVSPAYCIYRFSPEVLPKYYHYLYKTDLYKTTFKAYSTGIIESRLRLYSDKLGRIESLLPSFPEQQQIARYLDWQTAKINQFTQAKMKLIALLKEQKQNIINEAVTKGINPDVEMKDSGAEWLGKIPTHWEVRKLKTITKILRGKFSFRPRNDPSLYDGDYPFIQTGDVARAGKYITTYKQTLNEKGYLISKEFPKGTLTMTIAANIGEVAILDYVACFPDSIVGFVPKETAVDFLYYLFLAMKLELISNAPVNTQGNLNIERVGKISCSLPPIEEQQAIVVHIEKETTLIDKTIARTEREIELIQEYRIRLVSDVVTGKMDVRSIEIPDFEPASADLEVPDDEDSDLSAEQAGDELITEGITA
ncbi:MAG: restriction endonuclease subunit S [Parvibaculales bacterium]